MNFSDLYQFLLDNSLIGVFVTLILTFLNTIILFFKVKKSKLEKEYIKVNKELQKNFVPSDYVVLVNGVYYDMALVTFILRSDVRSDLIVDKFE